MTSVTAPDLVLDFVRTTSILHASKDDVLAVDNNSNGQANPGDRLEYTVVISNLVDVVGAPATNVTFSDTPDPNTTLVVGTVQSTLGTITSGNNPGDTTVVVDNIAAINDGTTMTITFQVEVNNPLPGCVAQVSNQGLINSDTLIDMPTDDPDTPAVDDPTDTPTFCLYDWGDAPDPTYPTLNANNGARHVLDGYTYLGAGVDDEADGQPDATATGDDADGNDDEDGVVFTSGLYPGTTADIDVTANQTCTLSAWIDFNIDGDWGEPDEDLFPGGQMVIPGVNSLSFPVPAGATLGTTYARFRCFAVGALSPTGEASNGEVEDYEVEIQAALSLGDLVWYDTDQDGIQDGGEPGVQNIVVDLYDTADCSGMPIDTDTTDASGLYGFVGLPPATYCLQFSNVPAGWTISPQNQGADDSLDSDADPATAQITNINLVADDPDEDVGLYAEGSIGDTVWCDVDGNNTYDAGEGVAGVTVDLYEDTNCDTAPDGAAIDTQDTVGDGQYLFTDLPVGPPGGPAVCYVVQVDVADMGACNNPITPVEYDVPLDADNPDDLDDDFGFSQLLSLGDYVWYDTDQDGLQDGGEPGVAGIDVTLYDNADCTGNVVGTDATDASGIYGFTGLTPATYCLQFSNIPAGWTITLQDQGADDSLDSDADPATAQITNINLTVTDLDEDVGLYTAGSIGDTVWCDTNGNSVYDAGEGVAGVTISLYEDPDCDTVADVLLATQDTTGDGQYLFTGLPVGPPGGPAVCYVVQVDVADMGACNNPITPVEYDVPLDADNPDDLDDDFGFTQQQLASIGDYVWLDTNQDGIQDGGESGVAGVTVNLYDGGGILQDSTTTDATGLYGFPNLAPGDYYVEFVLPSGYAFSPQDQGADDSVDSDASPATGRTVVTTLDPGENDPTWDAGMYRTGPAIQIDKTVNLAAVAPVPPFGARITYTLSVANVGDVCLNPVRVVDTLDVGLLFIPGTATPAETSIVGQVVTWDDVTSGAGLAPGGSTQITFEARVTTTIGTYVNYALAEGTPPVGGVVTDTDQVPVAVADPSVALDKGILAPGVVDGYITFTIQLSNTGPSVIEVLPLYDSFTGDIRYYTGTPVADAIDNVNGTLTWNDLTTYFGDMSPGQSFVVETVFEIVSSGDTFSATNVAR
ncbi:MAG: SdrD B-like domain-containing protein, partial [Anaerolineae bacterium]